jgi:hypothetical protein
MKGWRTMIVGAVLAVAGVALLIVGPAEQADLATGLIASGAAMAGLRKITTGPVGE